MELKDYIEEICLIKNDNNKDDLNKIRQLEELYVTLTGDEKYIELKEIEQSILDLILTYSITIDDLDLLSKYSYLYYSHFPMEDELKALYFILIQLKLNHHDRFITILNCFKEKQSLIYRFAKFLYSLIDKDSDTQKCLNNIAKRNPFFYGFLTKSIYLSDFLYQQIINELSTLEYLDNGTIEEALALVLNLKKDTMHLDMDWIFDDYETNDVEKFLDAYSIIVRKYILVVGYFYHRGDKVNNIQVYDILKGNINTFTNKYRDEFFFGSEPNLDKNEYDKIIKLKVNNKYTKFKEGGLILNFSGLAIYVNFAEALGLDDTTFNDFKKGALN